MIFLADASIATLIGLLIGMLIGITGHEFSHALVADRLGDHRPRAMGRVSLNPLRHLDPLGTLLLVVVGIGWGKPVMVAPEALRPGRVGMAMVAGAGPVANVVMAVIVALAFRALDAAGVGGLALEALYVAVGVNLLLALLNLIPIPPLDGFAVLTALVPPQVEAALHRYANYGFILLILLLLVPNSPLDALLGLAFPWARLLCGLPV